MSIPSSLRLSILPLFLNIASSSASPISSLVTRATTHTFARRSLGAGATAGLGIGVAIAAILLILLLIFFIVHYRRTIRLAAFERERAAVSRGLSKKSTRGGAPVTTKFGEAGLDDDLSKELQVEVIPRRQKSIRDRLMGPLYHDNTTDPLPLPDRAHARKSRLDSPSDDDLVAPGNMSKRSTIHSFSSRRATRMMMMM